MNQNDGIGSEIKPSAFVTALPKSDSKYFSILKDDKSYKLRSGHVILQPGESVGEHSTNNYEELVIALSGNGEIEAEGLGRMKFGEGQVAYNPPNTKHNVINTGNEPFEYIYVVTIVD
ncbi:MAG: cupin domain-containing protein [candidate division Zixibacteria bacterium]|nr:cupin domain-containing protein [candidate division Zixibacteria bacterium]